MCVCGEESEAVPILPPAPTAILTAVGALTSRPGIPAGVSQDSPHSNSLPTHSDAGKCSPFAGGLLILELREAQLETRFWFEDGKDSLHLPARVGLGAGEGPLQVTGEMASISGALGGGDRPPCPQPQA